MKNWEGDKVRRGYSGWLSCPTPYCGGWEGRCLFCGGRWSECSCGFMRFDACICGAQAESLSDIRNVNWIGLIVSLFYQIQALFYGDFWWFTHGWRGK